MGSRDATLAAAREPSSSSLKKTDSDPKKTRQRRPSEEDGPVRRCTFTPAELLQIRVGGHKGHDNERSLALNRIRKATVTDLPFKRPRDFDLQKYDDDGRFGFGEGKKIKLVFRIDEVTGQHLL